MKFPPAARVCCPVLSPCTCDSGAVAAGTGTVGSSLHLAGAALLPGAVLVGGGRGHGVAGVVWGDRGGHYCSTATSIITLQNFYFYYTLLYTN